MAGTVSGRWFWPDWLSDPELRACSFAARGLWMDMLCIAAQAKPVGHLMIADRAMTTTDIQRVVGGETSEIEILLAELERNRVFSRTRKGVIYSRRIVRDAKKAKTSRENGKKGGNPSLGKHKYIPASDNPPDNTPYSTTSFQTPVIGGGGSARGADPHDEILAAAGIDPTKDAFGKWYRPEQIETVARWRAAGFSQAEIVAEVRAAAAGRSPPSTLAYFERVFERALARRQSPPLQPASIEETHRARLPAPPTRAEQRSIDQTNAIIAGASRLPVRSR